jgi:hypothetical protein
MMQTLALKIGLAFAIMAGACGATWGLADAFYSRQYAALVASYEQAAKDQKAQVDKTVADNQAAAKAVDDEAKSQIGSMASVITTLSVRNAAGRNAVHLCPAPASAPIADAKPERPADTAGDRPAAIAAEPDIGIARDTVTGALTVGIDALKAELLFREYVRKTGQAK